MTIVQEQLGLVVKKYIHLWGLNVELVHHQRTVLLYFLHKWEGHLYTLGTINGVRKA